MNVWRGKKTYKILIILECENFCYSNSFSDGMDGAKMISLSKYLIWGGEKFFNPRESDRKKIKEDLVLSGRQKNIKNIASC